MEKWMCMQVVEGGEVWHFGKYEYLLPWQELKGGGGKDKAILTSVVKTF